jgi:hypothetical protein
MQKFFRKPGRYCGKKFSSHQVNASSFWLAVDECINHWPKENGLPPQRAVVVTSFREPIEMTISWIHQVCNKNRSKRSEEVLAACDVCNYTEHTDVWDTLIEEATSELKSVFHVARGDTDLERIQILSIDTPYINDFFDTWKPDMIRKRVNPEKRGIAAFTHHQK